MYTTANGNPCEAEPGSKVYRDYVPDWFTERILDIFGSTEQGYRDGYLLIAEHGLKDWEGVSWFDHVGSTLVDGVPVFVSESYLQLDHDFSSLSQFAQELDCYLEVSDVSYHFPGKTIRLAFLPNDMESVRGQRWVRFANKRKEITE